MDELIHDRVTLYGELGTRETVQKVQPEEIRAVPDMRWVLQKLIISGNSIGAQLVNTGTPVKELVGVAPTGVSFKTTGYTRVDQTLLPCLSSLGWKHINLAGDSSWRSISFSEKTP